MKKILLCLAFLPLSLMAQEAIDLGLSVKWADCNLGATKAEDYGGYYGWADPTGEETFEDVYDLDWNWLTDSLYGGFKPPKEICGTNMDVVSHKWGKPWRLPTHTEMYELLTHCKKKVEIVNGVHGFRFTGPSGKSIFLPIAGKREGKAIRSQEKTGCYWTGTVGIVSEAHRDSRVWYLFFNRAGYIECSEYGIRSEGFSIRPVRR